MLTQKLVYVLDDDPSMLHGIERLLRARRLKAKFFDSVSDFESRANLHEALCMVLDIGLDGKSGIELRHEMRLSGVHVPVIFMTADDSETTRNSALQTGCVAYLTKPFEAKSLIDAIEEAVGQAAA